MDAGSCGVRHFYTLVFAAQNAGSEVEVSMGDTLEINLQPPTGLGSVLVHNMRSFQMSIARLIMILAIHDLEPLTR